MKVTNVVFKKVSGTQYKFNAESDFLEIFSSHDSSLVFSAIVRNPELREDILAAIHKAEDISVKKGVRICQKKLDHLVDDYYNP